MLNTSSVNTTNPKTESDPAEHKYHTRYGIMTAPAAALDLLERAKFRTAFIGTMFQLCGKDGDGVTIPGYEAGGLAYILEDICHDIETAYSYYYGDDDYPGKNSDVPEGQS